MNSPRRSKPSTTGAAKPAGAAGTRARRSGSGGLGRKAPGERERAMTEAQAERLAALPPPSGEPIAVVIQTTVEGLGFDLVDIERLPRGLLRISIDRVPGREYPVLSEFVTVDDCELVTRQLQWVLEVERVSYERLEVSSPGLDRPLRKPEDWVRFCGLEVEVTFKMPFMGRKKFKGLLVRAEPAPQLVIVEGKQEQALDFSLEEVREARLVPVVNFKGRSASPHTGEQEA